MLIRQTGWCLRCTAEQPAGRPRAIDGQQHVANAHGGKAAKRRNGGTRLPLVMHVTHEQSCAAADRRLMHRGQDDCLLLFSYWRPRCEFTTLTAHCWEVQL